MDWSWASVADLEVALRNLLEARHPGLVSYLSVRFEGDTLVLLGEVASEDCRADAKLLALSFDGIFKVWNRLVVAGFLEPATDDGGDDYFFSAEDFEPGAGTAAVGGSDGSSGSAGAKSAHFGSGGASVGVADMEDLGAPISEEVTRTPVVDADRPIEAGGEFVLKVDLVREHVTGVEPMTIGTFPVGWPEIVVTVTVLAPWIAETDALEPAVTLSSDGKSRPASFRCSVVEDLSPRDAATVQVVLSHGTRICGCVVLDLPKAAAEADLGTPDGAATAKPSASTVVVAPDAAGPSLSVTISPDRNGRQFWTWRAAVPGGVEEDAESIDLGGGDRQFADDLLRNCPGLAQDAYRQVMRGVGERLWASAPARFRAAFLDWRHRIGEGFPIQFVTDDPHVPWEMMKPDDAGIDHLFLEHPVARWPLTRGGVRRHALPEGAVLSFVPRYGAGDTLPSALLEGEWLRDTFEALEMTADRSTFMNLLESGYAETVGVLHFAGHGVADTGIANGGIELEDAVVSVIEVNQSAVVLGRRDGTLVILNACETSAGSRMLGMNTGWGAALAERGFGGLVAPLWEVEDGVALTMLQTMGPSLLEGRSTLGEALAEARRESAEVSVSAFAYLAHGDVMARFPLRR